MRVSPSDPVSYQEVWEPAGARAPSLRDEEALDGFARAVAARLERAGFRAFSNGGTPLLERRLLHWRLEAVPRLGRALSGPPPVRWEVFLTNEDLKRVRRLYWRPAFRAPSLLGAGPLGALETPPRRTVYLRGDDPDAAANAVAEDLAGLALPWAVRISDPARAEDALFGPGIPLLDHQAAIELLLLHDRGAAARRYLEAFVARGDEFWSALETVGDARAPEFDHADPVERLAAIALLARLL